MAVATVLSVALILFVNEKYLVMLLGQQAARHVADHAQEHLSPADFHGRDAATAEKDFAAFFTEIKTEEVRGVRVWDAQSQVVYYNDPYHGSDEFQNPGLLADALAGRFGYAVMSLPQAGAGGSERFLAMYVPVRFSDAGGLDGVIEVHYSLRASDTIMYTLSWTFVLFGVAGSVILVVGFLVLFRLTVSRRLVQLQQTTRQIAKGNYQQRAAVGPPDEIGVLAASFNAMADQIQKDYRTLDDRIREQTRHLTDKIKEDKEHEKEIMNALADRDAANADLRETRARISAMINCVGEALIAFDRAGTITFVNRSAEELFSWKSPQDAVGKKYTDVLFLEDAPGTPVPFEKRPITVCLATKKMVDAAAPVQYYFRRTDGTRFPASIIVSPIVSGTAFVGVISSVRDATTEAELDRSKTEFASIASHQLRTPLSAIKWYAEMLLGNDFGKLNREQERYLQEVSDSNDRMIDLVNALLNVSRIDLGELAVNPVPLALKMTVESVLKESVLAAGIKRVHLVKKFGKLPKIVADPTLVRIVVQNLLSNAFTYTPKGGNVTITLAPEETSVLLTVADTGCGIPKKHQNNIFMKFFRADNARVVQPSGNGLGLYTTKAAVERMGGKIWFTSEENVGTTFFVRLPLQMEKKAGTKTLV